jgi:hypothetical protein
MVNKQTNVKVTLNTQEAQLELEDLVFFLNKLKNSIQQNPVIIDR